MLNLIRGDDTTITVNLSTSQQAGYAATLSFRVNFSDPTPVARFESSVDQNGSIVFILDSLTTQNFPVGRMVADVEVRSPEGTVQTVVPSGNRNGDPVIQVMVFADVTQVGDS